MIDVGDAVTIKATYTDADGSLTDPSTPVTVAIRPPSGGTVTQTATRQSEGIFQVEYVTTHHGEYNYTFFTSDNSVTQGSFRAQRVMAQQ